MSNTTDVINLTKITDLCVLIINKEICAIGTHSQCYIYGKEIGVDRFTIENTSPF